MSILKSFKEFFNIKSESNKHCKAELDDDIDKFFKFMPLAWSTAELSKADNTKVGCVVVAKDGSVRSLGYNGAPRGCSADEVMLHDYRKEKPEKYYWIEHAERNSIYNAARSGVSLEGCIMVTTHMPCMDCARAIVQSGIKVVLTNRPDTKFLQNWGKHTMRTEQLFKECGVKLLCSTKRYEREK